MKLSQEPQMPKAKVKTYDHQDDLDYDLERLHHLARD